MKDYFEYKEEVKKKEIQNREQAKKLRSVLKKVLVIRDNDGKITEDILSAIQNLTANMDSGYKIIINEIRQANNCQILLTVELLERAIMDLELPQNGYGLAPVGLY